MKISFISLIFLSLFFGLKSQERIYFPYFEIINMQDAEPLQYSTSKLLKTYIEESHDYLIVLPKKDSGIYPREDFLESIENAKKYNASYLLVGEINNLGKVAILSLSLFEVNSGNRIWKDLIKSIPLDDFDPVLSRLGRNFATQTTARDDADIYDITNYEEQREMKLLTIQANHFTGIMLGGNYCVNNSFAPRFGVVYTYDISSVLLNIDMEYSSNNFFHFISMDEPEPDFLVIRTGSFGMGVIVPFYKRKNSMYANGGFEFGATNLQRNHDALDKTEGGLDVYLGAGYLMARTSTANVRFELGLSVPTYKVNGKSIYQVKFGIITSFATIRK